MEKVVLTTYRKLYRMCRRVDASVAMRTQLVCCPLQVYEHRLMEWQPFDLSQMDWAESRSYLDSLIRRLNNGSPQYLPPLPEEAAKAIEEYKAQCTLMFAEEEKNNGAAASAAATAEAERAATATTAAAAAGTKGGVASSSTSTSDGTATAASRGAAVPLNVLPYSKLTLALRRIYEETPFSMGNVANGFAAVKELQYVCDLDDAGRANLITLSAAAAEGSAPLSSLSDIPHLQRALEVAPLHNSLINGLSAEQRVSLEQQSRQLRRSPRRKAKNSPLASMAAATAAAASGVPAGRHVGGNAFDEAPELGEAEMDGEEDEDEDDDEELVDLSDRVEGEAAFKEAAAGTTAQPTPEASAEDLSGSLPSPAELLAAPEQVQLLLAHPTARGFFRRTALLMVRHVTHESAAFVLNKPLRNDEGVEMSIEATVRLGRVHPIFRRHLAQHTLMIGGPVMSGSSFDESIFLLHRVPGIANALPLGSGLWMDGDLDALMAKVEAKEASAERDIVVLCGFAGWGFDQLKGEVDNGYWVVASGPSADNAIGEFVMALAHNTTGRPADGEGKAEKPAGAAAVAEPEPTTAAPTEAPSPVEPTAAAPGAGAAANTDAASIVAEAQRAAEAAALRAAPALKHRRRRTEAGKGKGSRVETLSWVRAFAALGEPYADMAMNQKAYAKDDDTQE